MFDNKQKRKLKYIWNILINTKHYVIPKTRDDWNNIDFLESNIKIDSTNWYFTERIKQELKSFVDIIYSIPEMNNALSYNTIFKTTLKELEYNIQNKIKPIDNNDFESITSKLSQKLTAAIIKYTFFFEIDGIEFQDINNLNLGDMKLFVFDKSNKKQLIEDYKNKELTDAFKKHIQEFIDIHFLDKLCVSCSANGDDETAEKIAHIKINELINVFRFIVCIHTYDRIYDNIIKINIISQTYTGQDNILAVNNNCGEITLKMNRNLRSIQNLPLNEAKVKELKEDLFLNDIIKILNSSERSQVEGIIITSIYWIGEAQNEFNKEISFLKFWTALECIFSHNKVDITKTLAKGVSILIGFSNYRFIEIENISEIYKSVSKLYDLRSKIVHGGMRNCVTNLQLIDICKFTSWTILSLLSLREMGYDTMDKIDKETTRLHSKMTEEK